MNPQKIEHPPSRLWPDSAVAWPEQLVELPPGPAPEAEAQILEALHSLDQKRAVLQEALGVLRGARGQTLPHAPHSVGELIIDTAAWRVTLGGERLSLSPTEFRVLALLAEHIGEVVSYDTLVVVVWHDDRGWVSREMVRTCVWRMRKRLEPDPHRPQYIVGVPRVGYRLRSQAQWQAAQQGTIRGSDNLETER
jgi:DNA-binding response OmpR family regulator